MNNPADGLADGRIQIADGRRYVVENGFKNLLCARSLEGQHSGKDLVTKHAESEYVGRRRTLLVSNLLR